MEKEKAKDNVKEKVKDRHEVAIAQIPESLPTASRYLSEAAASLAAGAVPATGFALQVPPLVLSYEAPQAVQPVDTRTANLPAFTDAGVQAAQLLSTGAAHVAHATPVVAAAAPLIALPVGLQHSATA